jgi:hypothetical protein
MGKHATVSFSIDQFDEGEPTSPLSEEPMSFEGEYRGMESGRMHVYLDPELDQAFLEKRANIRIEQSFNKEYRGIYVGDAEDGSAVFDKINSVR